MARTDGFGRVLKQKAVRAGGLVTMVFDDEWLARKPGEKERSKGRPGSVEHIGFPDEPPKLDEIRIADHAKCRRTIIVVPRRSLRVERNSAGAHAVRLAAVGEP